MEETEPSGRRGGREGHGSEPTAPLLLPLLLGRATALRQSLPPPALRLDERRIDWGYSRTVVALDIVWNLAFVIVSASVLLTTPRERPSTPLRAWVLGYVLQCLLHAGYVCFECGRRRRGRAAWRRRRSRWAGEGEEDELEGSRESRAMKKLDSLNAMVSLLWWILGFYWIVVGGQALLQDAPRLYWLTVVFLVFDVFFAIFCVTLACIIGLALFCCLPCIIAFLYAVAGQEGASDADLSTLPKFRFRRANQPEKFDSEEERTVSITIIEPTTCNPIDDLELAPENSECCICLSQYEDGVELHSLPCNHHFHSGCIVKWLRINARCPLCKYNILGPGDECV